MKSGLKCTVPGCRAMIRGMTGLQELNRLDAHFRRIHGQALRGEQLLELRVKIENGETIYVSGGDR